MHYDRESARVQRSGVSIHVVSEHTWECLSLIECLYHKCCRANGLRDSCSTIREAACLESIGKCQHFGLVGHLHACLSACPRTFCKAYSDHMQTWKRGGGYPVLYNTTNPTRLYNTESCTTWKVVQLYTIVYNTGSKCCTTFRVRSVVQLSVFVVLCNRVGFVVLYNFSCCTTFHDQCCEQLDRQAETRNDMV